MRRRIRPDPTRARADALSPKQRGAGDGRDGNSDRAVCECGLKAALLTTKSGAFEHLAATHEASSADQPRVRQVLMKADPFTSAARLPRLHNAATLRGPTKWTAQVTTLKLAIAPGKVSTVEAVDQLRLEIASTAVDVSSKAVSRRPKRFAEVYGLDSWSLVEGLSARPIRRSEQGRRLRRCGRRQRRPFWRRL